MRCKVCKIKFEPKYFNQKTCIEVECILSYSKEIKAKQWNKDKKEIKESLKTKQDYEKELEVIVNKFIRLRDKDEPCISCNASPNTFTKSAGHYFPAGSNKNIRFDEDNIHLQCWYNCNKNKSGNLSEYLPRLINKIGQQRFDELVVRKNTPRHYSIPELKELKIFYNKKIKLLG